MRKDLTPNRYRETEMHYDHALKSSNAAHALQKPTLSYIETGVQPRERFVFDVPVPSHIKGARAAPSFPLLPYCTEITTEANPEAPQHKTSSASVVISRQSEQASRRF